MRFQPLGRDLAGWWTRAGKPRVEEGALLLECPAHVSKQFPSVDFELKGQVRLQEARESFGAIWLREARNQWSTTLKFLGNGAMEVRRGDPIRAPMLVKASKGTWQSFVLTCRGNALSLDLDGKRALNAEVPVGKNEMLSLVAPYEGGAMAFKDLWLRELGPDGKPPGAATPAP